MPRRETPATRAVTDRLKALRWAQRVSWKHQIPKGRPSWWLAQPREGFSTAAEQAVVKLPWSLPGEN